jgi:hypothetical protein
VARYEGSGVMTNKDGHRRFGNIRPLPSGRFQIRYPGPDGRMRTGADTYPDKRSADRALSLVEGQMITGEWTDRSVPRSRSRSTRTGGSISAPTFGPGQSSCTGGCWPGTSARTWAGYPSGRSAPK